MAQSRQAPTRPRRQAGGADGKEDGTQKRNTTRRAQSVWGSGVTPGRPSRQQGQAAERRRTCRELTPDRGWDEWGEECSEVQSGGGVRGQMEVMNPRIHKARGLGGLALSRARVLGDDVGWRCCALLGRENSSQEPVIPTHPVITSVWAGAGGEQVLCDRNLTEQKQASRRHAARPTAQRRPSPARVRGHGLTAGLPARGAAVAAAHERQKTHITLGKCPTSPAMQALTVPGFPGNMGLKGGQGDSRSGDNGLWKACLAGKQGPSTCS